MKNIDHHRARSFGHIYKFIDDLITMNDSKEYENSFKEIYPAVLVGSDQRKRFQCRKCLPSLPVNFCLNVSKNNNERFVF